MLRQAMSSELTATVIRRHTGPITTPHVAFERGFNDKNGGAPTCVSAARSAFAPHLPESSCDLFPVGDAIVVPRIIVARRLEKQRGQRVMHGLA